MSRLPHGHRNLTRRLPGGFVEKRYDGANRWENFDREVACLTQLMANVPVPEVVDVDRRTTTIVLRDVPGRHGYDLMAQGHGVAVMRLVAATLARLQALPTDLVAGLDGDGPVIVHGDFGPQNMIFDLATDNVTAVLDWESAHLGETVEDLAWAEWIVRLHYPEDSEAVAALVASSDHVDPWGQRRASMVRKCRSILSDCTAAGLNDAASEWERRLEVTEGWSG